MKFRVFLFVTILCLIKQESFCQTIPLGAPIIENYLRRQQLLGNLDPAVSFNYRPLTFTKNGIERDSLKFLQNGLLGHSLTRQSSGVKVVILPIELRLAQDLQNPDSRNDGAMIRARGWQSYVAAGVYTEVGLLTIQLKPEFVWAQNKDYPGFPDWPRHYESTWQVRYNWYNRIDQPERYGTKAYTRVNWGQSSIRLNTWGMSLGLSTENLWWGPSIRNSIAMSNNAEGFPHLTFNSQRPLKSSIGSFEWQFITGRLRNSSYLPPNYNDAFRGYQAFVPKADDWRYYQALSFSYSPKWVKGLSLGLLRWTQQYHKTVKETNGFFPVLSGFFKANNDDQFGINSNQDAAAGLFGRWFWVDSNAELYFEYYKKNSGINFRDLLVDNDNARAFTLGINKIIKISATQSYWQFGFEWTQTSQNNLQLINNSASWYVNNRIRHGYTQNGETLGSALGPGGNSQYLELSKIKGFTRIGGAIERRVHNNDFAITAFAPDFTRYWIDYNIHGFIEIKFKNLLLSGSLFFTKSLNYQWEVLFDPNDPTAFPDTPGVDRVNWNLDIKAAYTL